MAHKPMNSNEAAATPFDMLMALRPAEDTAEAMLASIEPIMAKRDEFLTGVAARRERRKAMLLQMSPAEIRKLDEEIAELEIAAEQAVALGDEIAVRLKARITADRRADLERQRAALLDVQRDFARKRDDLYATFVRKFRDVASEYEGMRQRERALSNEIGRFNEGEGAATPLEQLEIDLVSLAVFEGTVLVEPGEPKFRSFIRPAYRGRYWTAENPGVDPRVMETIRLDAAQQRAVADRNRQERELPDAQMRHKFQWHNDRVAEREREAAQRA